ncbi:MAG: MoaD/ThiS family protein [Proteobacteria bacterium]|nr:MoaD/ThiS family protein [Pseudomonadota bacterium]
MKVFIPDALRSYTAQERCVSADGSTLDELLHDLDRRYPGIRFRMINEQDQMRPHVAFFVRGQKTRNIGESLHGADEVVIMQALSGG